MFSGLDADTTPSPGIRIGITARDVQGIGSQGRQIAANPGSGTVHFAWTMQDFIPDESHVSDEHYDYDVNYNSFDKTSGTLNQGLNGQTVSIGFFNFDLRGGFVRIDVGSNNHCHAVFQQGIEPDSIGSSWHLYFPIESSGLHLNAELPDPADYPDEPGQSLPAVAVTQNPALEGADTDVRHVIAGGESLASGHGRRTGHLWYWRYDTGAAIPAWEGPALVDSTLGSTWAIDAADHSDRVAFTFMSAYLDEAISGRYNVAYRESHTSGSGWIDGSELGAAYRNFATSLSDTIGPWVTGEAGIAYDHSGTLHIVFLVTWGSSQGAIMHWSDAQGAIHPAATAYYDNAGVWDYRFNICQLSLGIGDGSTPCDDGAETNEDYLYVLYTKLGGVSPEEQADTSARGWSNAELYLTASPDGGARWSPPVNLTNTKSPGCDSDDPAAVCASESGGSIVGDVTDIEVMYIRDYEAGELYLSGITMNDVMYLSIPGGTTDAALLCPYIPPCECPCSGDPQCDGVANILDVVRVVDVAFRGTAATCDEWCLHDRTDVDCDGVTNVLDVVRFVNVTFRGADPAATYCDPCAP